jgi:hypothetical protein
MSGPGGEPKIDRRGAVAVATSGAGGGAVLLTDSSSASLVTLAEPDRAPLC